MIIDDHDLKIDTILLWHGLENTSETHRLLT